MKKDDFYKHLDLLDNKIRKSYFNDKCIDYVQFIRRNESWGLDRGYDYPSIETIGVRNIIDDVVNSLSLYIWRGNDKMFDIVSKNNPDVNLTELSNFIQNKLNDATANFVPALQEMLRDWIEFGSGFICYNEKKKGMPRFKSLPPYLITIDFDEWDEIKNFYLREKWNRDVDDEVLILAWEKNEKNNLWAYKKYKFNENDDLITEFSYKDMNQQIFGVMGNTTSDTPFAMGKGLLMLDLFKLINNIFEALSDSASNKIDKALILDETTALSLKQLGQTVNSQTHKIEFPIYTIKSQGEVITTLDNRADPALAQWLFQITTAVVQQTFSINRLLATQDREMTATEVNYRASLDQKYIDFAVKTFKTQFLDILVKNMMLDARKEDKDLYYFDGEIEDYRIVWGDKETKAVVNERLQEMSVAMDLIMKLTQFGQATNIDVSSAIKEVATKTSFVSTASTQETITSDFLNNLANNQSNLGDGNA